MMASSFSPDPSSLDDPLRTGTAASTRLRRVASRIVILAVILSLLGGVFVAVHATSTRTPAGVTPAGGAAHLQAASPPQTDHGSTGWNTAPDFTLPLLSGVPFHLAAQRGHVVVLYFMATGCAGCEPGSTTLAQTLTAAHIQGAEALAIDVNGFDRPADLQTFVQSLGIPPSAPVHWGIDTTGAIATTYGVQTLETTIVIDPHGQIAYRSDGALPAQLAQIVRNLA
jgi:peroxiredoxin